MSNPPGPAELYEQAGGDRVRYIALMKEHGYLIEGKREPLPCGWPSNPARRTVVQPSPMAPPDPDPVVREVADMLRRILVNYEREGSGPGSRFEGEMLETVQARAVIRHFRELGTGDTRG